MKIRNVIMAPAALAAAALGAAPAMAQEYVKVENAAREQLPESQFVGAAYGFIWLALLVYVVLIARSLGRTRTEIDELKRRVERLSGDEAGGGGAR